MRTTSSLIAVAAVLAAAGAVSAATVTANFTYTLQKDADITASPKIYDGNVSTVAFHWTRADKPGTGVDSTVPITFDTYCVDLAQNVSKGHDYTFNVVPIADAGYTENQVLMLSRLWAANKAGIDTTTESAAFQLAVWEIVYDTNNDTSTGSFKVNSSSTLRNAAQSLINVAMKEGANAPLANLVVLRSSSAQDQLTEIPVPSAGTAALALAGVGMALPRRKARK